MTKFQEINLCISLMHSISLNSIHTVSFICLLHETYLDRHIQARVFIEIFLNSLLHVNSLQQPLLNALEQADMLIINFSIRD